MSPNAPINTRAHSSVSLDNSLTISGSSSDPRDSNCVFELVPVSNSTRLDCDANVNCVPVTSVILPCEYEILSPRPTNDSLTTELFEFHWRKSSRASSNEQSMFHLLAAELGEQQAILAVQQLRWNIDIGSGNLMPLQAIQQHSKHDLLDPPPLQV